MTLHTIPIHTQNQWMHHVDSCWYITVTLWFGDPEFCTSCPQIHWAHPLACISRHPSWPCHRYTLLRPGASVGALEAPRRSGCPGKRPRQKTRCHGGCLGRLLGVMIWYDMHIFTGNKNDHGILGCPLWSLCLFSDEPMGGGFLINRIALFHHLLSQSWAGLNSVAVIFVFVWELQIEQTEQWKDHTVPKSPKAVYIEVTWNQTPSVRSSAPPSGEELRSESSAAKRRVRGD